VKSNTAINGFSNYKSNGHQNGDYKSSEFSSNRGFRSRSREGRTRRGADPADSNKYYSTQHDVTRKRSYNDTKKTMPYSSYSGESESTARHKDYESIDDSDSRKPKRDDRRDPDRSNSSDYRRRRGNETGNRQRRAQKSRRTDYSDEYYRGDRPHSEEREKSSSYHAQSSRNTYQSSTTTTTTNTRSNNNSSKNNKKPEYSDKQTRERHDDDDNHLRVELGKSSAVIKHRRCEYRADKLLGEGTFGKVFRVTLLDTDKREKQAMKIIKSEDRYVDSAQLEINVLRKIRDADPKDEFSCIRLLDDFMYHGHPCLTFPILGKSTYDFQKDNDYRPFKFDQVKKMSFQLIRAVKFLHDMKLTHTDLKPENILFVDDRYDEFKSRSGKTVRVIRDCSIKLIDFGSATFEQERKTRIVATRHYRPPEVIMELTWSHPCDVWSIGCIMFEWYMGICMFQTHDNREHLAMMERILGPFPDRMTRESKKAKKYFYKKSRASVQSAPSAGDNDLYRVDWDWESSDGRYVRENCKPLDRYNQLRTDYEHNALFHLMRVMLDYDPTRRITLAEALRHRFIEPEYEKYLEERRHTRKIEDSIHELIYPKSSKSKSSSREDRRGGGDDRRSDDRRGSDKKNDRRNNNFAPDLNEITKTIKSRGGGSGKTYLDRLLEEDSNNNLGNSGGSSGVSKHVSSGNNKIYENTKKNQVVGSNGRGAGGNNGEWVRRDGKWVQLEEELDEPPIQASVPRNRQAAETYC